MEEAEVYYSKYEQACKERQDQNHRKSERLRKEAAFITDLRKKYVLPVQGNEYFIKMSANNSLSRSKSSSSFFRSNGNLRIDASRNCPNTKRKPLPDINFSLQYHLSKLNVVPFLELVGNFTKNEPNFPKVIKLKSSPIKFGRSRNCDVVLDSLEFPHCLSKLHASVFVSRSLRTNAFNVSIEDHGGANGTYLNCHRLKSGSRIVVEHGDIVAFGKKKFCYLLHLFPAYHVKLKDID